MSLGSLAWDLAKEVMRDLKELQPRTRDFVTRKAFRNYTAGVSAIIPMTSGDSSYPGPYVVLPSSPFRNVAFRKLSNLAHPKTEAPQ
jgi:hypothetical protein